MEENTKLPDDVLQFLKDLDGYTDPYSEPYVGSKMSHRLNDLLEKYVNNNSTGTATKR